MKTDNKYKFLTSYFHQMSPKVSQDENKSNIKIFYCSKNLLRLSHALTILVSPSYSMCIMSCVRWAKRAIPLWNNDPIKILEL